MKLSFFVLLIVLFAVASDAQQLQKPHTSKMFDLTATLGADQGSLAAAFIHNWRLGERRKFEIGPGIRLTGYGGTKKDFITAPAKLARTNTAPFLIVFAGQQESNFDTLTLQRPLLFMLNFSLNLGYHITPKWYGGINIDVIGVSFGRASSAVLTSNGTMVTEPVAKPTSFNLLLTGDNDKGSLNSEFFLKYQISNRWAAKAVYQFLFTEYTTTTTMQVAPDGTNVYRFRNKVNAGGIGVTSNLK